MKRIPLDKQPTFKSQVTNGKFKFIKEVRSKLDSANTAVAQRPPAAEKAQRLLQEGQKLIDIRQKLITIADRSGHGWAAVKEYKEDKLAESSDDEKMGHIRKPCPLLPTLVSKI